MTTIAPRLGEVLKRLALGGMVENNAERALIERLVEQLDKPVPAAACPACWLNRQIDEMREKVTQ